MAQMRIVGMVVALVLVARFGPAQASVEQLARCAAIPAAALRLQCYDTLAKDKSDSSSSVEGDDIVPTGNEVFMEAIVEEKPAVLSGPTLQYPELLRQAQIQGRVLVQAIIDTLGRAEPPSVKVLQSPNPGFDHSAKSYVTKALFRPGRVHGRAVRVLLQVPVDFKLRQ
jgi:TonB family protein